MAACLEGQDATYEKRALLCDVYIALIEVSFMENNLDGLEYASKALALVPDGRRFNFGDCLLLGNTGLFFLPDNAPDRLVNIFDFIDEFSALAKDLYNENSLGLLELFAAEAFYLAERLGDARERCAKAVILAGAAGQHDIVINGHILQLRMAIFNAEYIKAEKILQKIIDYSEQAAVPEIYPLRDFALGMFYIWLGELEKVPSWLSGGENVFTDIPMDIGQDRIVCALYRFTNGEYEAAYMALLELDSLMAEQKLWSMRLSSHIVKAVCLYQMGSMPKAVRALGNAYDMTWKNNIRICFAEFGKTMERLTAVAREQDDLEFDAQWL